MYQASYRWDFLTAPGTAMLVGAVVSMAVFRISPLRGLRGFRATLKQLQFVLAILAMVVGMGYLANYSGMSYTLGLTCATYTKKFFPVFSPAIGWLGVFLTGAVTSAAALFGKLQQVTATEVGLNPVLTTVSNRAVLLYAQIRLLRGLRPRSCQRTDITSREEQIVDRGKFGWSYRCSCARSKG
jgi:lactate permease